ncbi:MAG: aminoglycoside phosphotransferase family protein [bacterium]|nr:aminoglycoside phosphotransferase family protein [bacterium]MCP5069667.1 aminoglycoside phosphotransferase family protein [bacterium]
MLPNDHPLLAVISPPRIERFFEVAGIDPNEELTGDFGGWSKLVLLTRDRAFLFPRNESQVEAMEREIEGLRVFGATGLGEIPTLLDVWRDVGLGPYPIVAVQRLPGIPLERRLPGTDIEALGAIAERLGELAGRWHRVDPGTLARKSAPKADLLSSLDALLGNQISVADTANQIRACLRLDATGTSRARDALMHARALPPVPIHADLHEAQLLVEPEGRPLLTGVIDWQTSVVGHPFAEFDLEQWGPTIWREHRASFPKLRARFWKSYAPARGLDPELGRVFEWVYAVSLAMQFERDDPPTHDVRVSGTVDEARAGAVAATAKL